MATFFGIVYIIVLVLVCIRIIMHTSTPSKGLAYLLLVISLPVIGIIFYLSIGVNYRKSKLYQKKIDVDGKAFPELESKRKAYTEDILENNKEVLTSYFPLVNSPNDKAILADNNDVQLFINGETKFPEVIKSLRKAKNHIHIEYYIYEDDDIGNEIAEVLMDKARAGVEVRFIYDDFGSKSIRKKFVNNLREAGVEAVPFYEITFIHFASRVNYRNHRKIIVVDGKVGYVGGINVADDYVNNGKMDLFWRDTHLKISGTAVLNLQFTFLTDWNFCADQNIGYSKQYFPYDESGEKYGDKLVQIVSSGPDSDYPNIMYSLMQVLLLAKEELLITTPYFIPTASFLDAIKIATRSGVKIKLLVPGESDSLIVNTTSQSYYEDLLIAGVEIYKYRKGFVHAKTMVCDEYISVVGTANLDVRSFDLNFEINALVYDKSIATQLKNQYIQDLENADQVILSEWKKRPAYVKFAEKVLHLFSAVM